MSKYWYPHTKRELCQWFLHQFPSTPKSKWEKMKMEELWCEYKEERRKIERQQEYRKRTSIPFLYC